MKEPQRPTLEKSRKHFVPTLNGEVWAPLNRAALRHAERCLEWTEKFAAEMKDFDCAYAFKGLARAHALPGDREQASKFYRLAAQAGQTITDAGDQRIFTDDLLGGDRHGLR